MLSKVGMGWGDKTMILPDSRGSKEELERRLINMQEALDLILVQDTETHTDCFLIWCGNTVDSVCFDTMEAAQAKMLILREEDFNSVQRWRPVSFEEYSARWDWYVTWSNVV